MYLRALNGWQLWPSCHPAKVGCIAEEREQCDCKYHVIDEAGMTIHSFEDYPTAYKKFQELTGDDFRLGKDKWE